MFEFKHIVSSIYLALLGLTLCADPGKTLLYYPFQPQLTWDGSSLVEAPTYQMELHCRDAATGAIHTIKAPPRALSGLSLWDGIVSTLRIADNRAVYARRSLDETWQDFPTAIHLGDTDAQVNGIPLLLFEADTPGQFLAMNFCPMFGKGREGSPCSWWRQNAGGTLEAEGLVPLELDGPVLVPARTAKGVDPVELAPRYRGLAPFLEFPVPVPGAFLVVSWKAGIIWVIRASPAHSVRAIRLMALDEPRLAGKIPHPPVLLGLQPMANGHVLAAIRHEAAVLDPSVTDAEFVWKDIDPLEGKVTEADPALVAGYPAAFRPFTFDLEGHVVPSQNLIAGSGGN